MAGAKNIEKKFKVIAGTFPVSGGDQARKMLATLESAEIKGFSIKPVEKMPGYIQVISIYTTKEDAEKAIQEAAEKKIILSIAK